MRLNIAPLVDVLLLLLVFFLLTSSYVVPRALDLELPGSSTAEPTEGSAIVVGLGHDGRLSLNGQPLSHSAFGPALAQLLESRPQSRVQVRAHAGLSIDVLVGLLDELRLAGARTLVLETRDETR